MAGVSSTSLRLSPVPPIEKVEAAGGVDDAGESGGFRGAILHVAPSHETIKSHLFQGWTLAKLNGESPIIKATLEFGLERAPTEEARGKVTFLADIRSNRVLAITHSATLDQNIFSIPGPLITPAIYGEGLESLEARAQERLVLDALSENVGMIVAAISSEELHLVGEKNQLQFTAGIEHTPEPVIIPPTAEEIAESHQKLINFLQAKTSEQKAQRYDAICDLTLACNKGGSFPSVSNADLLGTWDLIAIDGIKAKDAVSYQWTGEEEGSLVLGCSVAKGKLHITASGDVLTSETGSLFETSTDSYQESRQRFQHRSSESDWYQINHFLLNPPVTLDESADVRAWKVVSFSEEHLLFSDTHFNSMLLTRKKEEGGAASGGYGADSSGERKSWYKKPFFKE